MTKKFFNRVFLNKDLWAFATAIVTAIGTIYPLYHISNSQLTGNLIVRPIVAVSVFPSAELNPELVKKLKLEFMHKKLNPSHIQLLLYTVQNMSTRIITPKDFYQPITLTTLGGGKIINIIANTEENRPPIIPVLENQHEAEIPPTLLNPRDSFSVTILLDKKNNVPFISVPYFNENNIQWTALIKGVSLISYKKEKLNNSLPSFLNVSIFHTGYAVLALFILGMVLSFAQIYRFFISGYLYQKNIYSSIEITFRVALAWGAAESIVSLFDMPTEAQIGYLFMVAYSVTIILPSLISINQFIFNHLSKKIP